MAVEDSALSEFDARPGTVRKPRPLRLLAAIAVLGISIGAAAPVAAGNGGVTYTYDALGRVLTASYDTGVIIIYTYDANGNRTSQVINANTQPLCLHASPSGSSVNWWGYGLWAAPASC
ncbi:MAG: RHS repeat protein [Caulobacteraceae bacterium]|nr:RHS repeat protein [Caulobacteraceae bacterium]